MSRPNVIHLRHSDADTLTRLIDAAGSRDADTLDLLSEEIDRARVVPDDQLPLGTVALDSQVRFCDESTGEEQEVSLVIPSRAAPGEGRISVLSPVGSALIGLSVGDTIDWPLPSGKVRRLRVLAVSSGETQEQAQVASGAEVG